MSGPSDSDRIQAAMSIMVDDDITTTFVIDLDTWITIGLKGTIASSNSRRAIVDEVVILAEIIASAIRPGEPIPAPVSVDTVRLTALVDSAMAHAPAGTDKSTLRDIAVNRLTVGVNGYAWHAMLGGSHIWPLIEAQVARICAMTATHLRDGNK